MHVAAFESKFVKNKILALQSKHVSSSILKVFLKFLSELKIYMRTAINMRQEGCFDSFLLINGF